MNEARKKVREYLAEIGKRGGLASRRELNQVARATNGRDPRDETRGDQSGQAVASTRLQTAEALLKISVSIIHHKPLTMDRRDGCSFRCLPQAWARLRVRARSLAPKLLPRPQVPSIVSGL